MLKPAAQAVESWRVASSIRFKRGMLSRGDGLLSHEEEYQCRRTR